MKYPVILIKSDEGFAVSCPALPGCWSQGKTEKAALANIREAIQLRLEVAEEDAPPTKGVGVEVTRLTFSIFRARLLTSSPTKSIDGHLPFCASKTFSPCVPNAPSATASNPNL